MNKTCAHKIEENILKVQKEIKGILEYVKDYNRQYKSFYALK